MGLVCVYPPLCYKLDLKIQLDIAPHLVLLFYKTYQYQAQGIRALDLKKPTTFVFTVKI